MNDCDMITIQEASERIGISVASLHGKENKKYKRFRKNIPSSRVMMFDIKGYEKMEGLNIQLISRVGQLIEYLNKEENMKYSYIAKMTRSHIAAISSLKFGIDVAFRVAKILATQRPFHVQRFDEYYGWKHIPRKTIKVLG